MPRRSEKAACSDCSEDDWTPVLTTYKMKQEKKNISGAQSSSGQWTRWIREELAQSRQLAAEIGAEPPEKNKMAQSRKHEAEIGAEPPHEAESGAEPPHEAETGEDRLRARIALANEMAKVKKKQLREKVQISVQKETSDAVLREK